MFSASGYRSSCSASFTALRRSRAASESEIDVASLCINLAVKKMSSSLDGAVITSITLSSITLTHSSPSSAELSLVESSISASVFMLKVTSLGLTPDGPASEEEPACAEVEAVKVNAPIPIPLPSSPKPAFRVPILTASVSSYTSFYQLVYTFQFHINTRDNI